eukprot:TRINITY_DN4530_c0_g1_i1.p1 TRINITY_DN4530_c0_g1~~TRINITY_DN4530_c0_g1_i1.p1  ORF type:complete len:492 (+),score=87.23 TRINITY_DN4530_c0_g1_i1:87-1562(+)
MHQSVRLAFLVVIFVGAVCSSDITFNFNGMIPGNSCCEEPDVVHSIQWDVQTSALDVTETNDIDFPADVADDPKIWLHETDVSQSVVFGSNKDENSGGLYAFNLDGSFRDCIAVCDIDDRIANTQCSKSLCYDSEDATINNLALLYNVELAEGKRDLLIGVGGNSDDPEENFFLIVSIDADGNFDRIVSDQANKLENIGIASEPQGVTAYTDKDGRHWIWSGLESSPKWQHVLDLTRFEVVPGTLSNGQNGVNIIEDFQISFVDDFEALYIDASDDKLYVSACDMGMIFTVLGGAHPKFECDCDCGCIDDDDCQDACDERCEEEATCSPLGPNFMTPADASVSVEAKEWDRAGTEIVDFNAPVGHSVERGGEVEGVAVYKVNCEWGYIIVSLQSESRFNVYDTRDYAYMGSFRLVSPNGNPAEDVKLSDGVHVVPVSLPGYPGGMLAVHHGGDDEPSVPNNYKFVSWKKIADALGLESVSTFNPRNEGDCF